MKKRATIGVLFAAVGALALIAAGCGGSEKSSSSTGGGGGGGGNVTALPASSCGPLEYEGTGDPDYLIATDLPMQGGSRTQTLQMVGAIRYQLGLQKWKAGDYNIAYQACDDSTAQLGKWDPDKCSANAHAYAQNSKLLANTYGCLTEPCAGDEPEKYYPSGKRTYARVAPSDPNQGAVDAKFMASQGVKTVSILNDKEAYGLGVAKNFAGAAKAAGIKVTGFTAYDPKQANFRALFTRIKGQNPDAVFIGGLIDENSGQLINDKVAILGPNNGAVKLMLPDGFTTDAVFDRSQGGTPNAKDAYFSVAGVGIDKYTGTAKTFINGFQATLNGKPVDPYAILGAQAGQVMLNAIEKSDGTRADVLKNVYATKVTNGLIGDFEFNENGDLSGAKGAAVLFTIYKGTNKLNTLLTTAPDPPLVAAARKEAAG